MGFTAVGTAQVESIRVPEGGLQPKVRMGLAGDAHLIFYRGEARGGDLFYAKKPPNGVRFGDSSRINSTAGSAIAAGTIRGGQLALGQNSQVHVIWNGSAGGHGRGMAMPLFYTRSKSDGSGFEDQRAISGDLPMDGGGAVAADGEGTVFVFFHSGAEMRNEGARRVFVRVSHDSGGTFGEARPISPAGSGVCACCSMQALAVGGGQVFVIYRTAEDRGRNRNIAIMASADGGRNWAHSIVDRWSIPACPMSSMSIARVGGRIVFAWEKAGQIFWGAWNRAVGGIDDARAAPGSPAERKHPVLASDAAGRLLIAWTTGTGWQQGGGYQWQMYDKSLRPIVSGAGRDNAVPVWGFVAVTPQPAGDGFVILH